MIRRPIDKRYGRNKYIVTSYGGADDVIGGWLFWDEGTVASQVGSPGVDCQLGINTGNYIIAVSGNTDDVYRYSNSMGWVTAQDLTGTASSPSSIFTASNGYVFAGLDNDGAGGVLFRSTNEGETWASVDTGSVVNDSVKSITEDDDGNLYIHYYPTYALKCSTDNGATWSAVTLPTDYTTTYPSHLHHVYWCQYRKVLMISGGDTTLANLFYTSQKGAAITAEGWTAIPDTHQAVGFTSDANYIYASHDSHSEQGRLYRVAWPVDGSPTSPEDVYSPVTDGTFAWNCGTDSNGYIWFVLSNSTAVDAKLIVSYDQGENWIVEKTFTIAGNPARGPYLFAKVSAYYTSWDGFYYGGSGDTPFARWRFYPDGSQFKIASTGDWLADGITNPWPIEAFAHIESLLSNDSLFTFQNAISIPLTLLTDNVGIDFNNYIASGAVSDTPEFSHDFETTLTWDATWGPNATFDNESTDFAYSGTKSFRVTATADGAAGINGYMTNEINAGDGSDCWISGHVYVPAWFDGNVNILAMTGSGQTLTLALKTDGRLTIRAIGTASGSPEIYAPISLITTGTWHKIKMQVHVANAGRVLLWVDDILVLSTIGFDTFDASWVSCWWGVYGTMGNGKSIYWDNVAFADSDPDQPSDVEVIADQVRLYNLNPATNVNYP